ncbi:excinuclease ABC subunit UvrC [Arenibacter sp. GZD96]|uniref:excinuclease ABC subunit UvrC n=1 Tax=Aurantibrevibacter litoralis TaxID=3106030 RepID=UPI002AFF24C6|nr:excinuclease ABC subunit UvrC [Arenibacter sp. GZD-96]MEA1786560.1 excinuclease ABC subunit UvrC [Arenibacter sp. GZD-96]
MSEVPIEIQLRGLPSQPGVYQFYDQTKKLLYVGKAKNIKKRVSSYFSKNHENGKTRVLVKKIKHIEHIVVATESDALLLENNLIKKHQPRYNVLLKDDKSYPWICIKNEPFPRIFPTRRFIKDGSEYYGPYTNMKTVWTLLELIKSVYALRTCNYDLSSDKIKSGKYNVCLEYHLKNCKGPCADHQGAEEYMAHIAEIREIIKGNFKLAIHYFKNQMKLLANALRFEEAQLIKEKLEILENYQAKSMVVHPKITNVDVFSILSDETYAYVNFLQISHGAIVCGHTIEIKKKLNESNKDLLQLAIVEIRQRFKSQSNEVYAPFELTLEEGLKLTVPKLGDKRKLVELSERNAKYYRQEQLNQIKITDPERHNNRILLQMKKDLRLSEIPTHIECFDNSNIQGTHPVAACVVFKDSKPSKKEYRHYNIKTVEGPDDFASMEEVVYRRYARLLNENEALPQLIVVDGGKGQLSSALKSLEKLNLRGKIAIIGIAKRLEEIYYPNDPIPLYLDKKSETLKVLQQLRNEAHRFGITFHRNKRSKAAIHSELEAIAGIGSKTSAELLKTFKSVKRIKEANIDDLAKTVGIVRAKKIFENFR